MLLLLCFNRILVFELEYHVEVNLKYTGTVLQITLIKSGQPKQKLGAHYSNSRDRDYSDYSVQYCSRLFDCWCYSYISVRKETHCYY